MPRISALAAIGLACAVAHCHGTGVMNEQPQRAPLYFADHNPALSTQPAHDSSSSTPMWGPLSTNYALYGSQPFLGSAPEPQLGMGDQPWGFPGPYSPMSYYQVPTAEPYLFEDQYVPSYAGYAPAMPQPWAGQSYLASPDSLVLTPDSQDATTAPHPFTDFGWHQITKDPSSPEQPVSNGPAGAGHVEPVTEPLASSAYALPDSPPKHNISVKNNLLPKPQDSDVKLVNGQWRTTTLGKAVLGTDLRQAIEVELSQMPEHERPKDYTMLSKTGYLSGGHLKVGALPAEYRRSKVRVDPGRLPIEIAAYWLRDYFIDITSRFFRFHFRSHLPKRPASARSISHVASPNLELNSRWLAKKSLLKHFTFGLYWNDGAQRLHSYLPAKPQSKASTKADIQSATSEPSSFMRLYSIPITHFHAMAAEILQHQLAVRNQGKARCHWRSDVDFHGSC